MDLASSDDSSADEFGLDYTGILRKACINLKMYVLITLKKYIFRTGSGSKGLKKEVEKARKELEKYKLQLSQMLARKVF